MKLYIHYFKTMKLVDTCIGAIEFHFMHLCPITCLTIKCYG